ncbi:MAG TPA: metallophosphoesterase [Acidimicrobiales bacterium]
MIRVAAVGDLHYGVDSAGGLRPGIDAIADRADLLLLAGDLTKVGAAEEAQVLVDDLAGIPVPTIAVLGNHDYHSDEWDIVTKLLQTNGVRVLEGGNDVVELPDVRVGIAGIKGFGGGFPGACASDFGEPEMKAFVQHTMATASRLEHALRSLDTDVRIALLHYSPVKDTLFGERLEIYPFLGSYLLAEAIDRAGADLVIHGHAHAGSEKGVTPGGIHVRNVAQPVIGHAYNVYCLRHPRAEPVCD